MSNLLGMTVTPRKFYNSISKLYNLNLYRLSHTSTL